MNIHAISSINYSHLHPASYSAFRGALNKINKYSSHRILKYRSMTLLLNQHKQLIALIKPPHINAYGESSPIQYFVASTAQPLSLPLFLRSSEQLNHSMHRLQKKLTRCLNALARQVLRRTPYTKRLADNRFSGVTQKHTAPLWTTVRLTA